LKDDVLTSTVSHEINTRTDSAPVKVRPYRLLEKHKKEVSRQIEKNVKLRNHTNKYQPMERANTGSSQKSDASGKRKLRIVADFRILNDLRIGDSYPLPNVTDILDQLRHAKIFQPLASIYHRIAMNEKENKTAFSTPYEHYEFNRMPFGLKNTPATFQQLMNAVLVDMQGIKCLVYLEDIVIYGSSLQ